LRALPGYEDYADWLSARLDYIEAATQAVAIPYYELWLQRVRGRPLPARAGELMPILRAMFAAEDVSP
jgi:membrane-bound lytic murein transglycosylase D